MATVNSVIAGLKNYLESELVSQLTGLNKWVVGAGLAMAIDNGAEIFEKLKKEPMVKALKVIDKEDNIDIDKLYKYLLEQAKKSSVTFSAPVVGAVTLKSSDVEKIYNMIKEAEK